MQNAAWLKQKKDFLSKPSSSQQLSVRDDSIIANDFTMLQTKLDVTTNILDVILAYKTAQNPQIENKCVVY